MTENPSEFPRIKLYRPHASAGWIDRPRLLAQLDQVLLRPAVLISAPAGFGKTTLLTQWLDCCPLPNAWLQLDAGDHEIHVFLNSVIAALRQIFPGCLPKTAGLQRAQSTVPLNAWLNALIDDLSWLEGTPFVLALDDYHLLGNPAIDMLLSDLLCYEFQPMHLILSARRSPALSFSRLRVQDKVVEIHPADLRFTEKEALDFLNRAIDLPLSAEVVHRLQEKTEGWAAGLALAAINLREEPHPERLLARLDVSDAQVNDYLLDQVFKDQPGEIQEFLLKTATFDQFCTSMLSEVFAEREHFRAEREHFRAEREHFRAEREHFRAEREHFRAEREHFRAEREHFRTPEQREGEIQALLEQIESAQLFLISLDSRRTFYRYHHLFRQMLLARQRYSIDPGQLAEFQCRAAAWCIVQNRLDEALGYLTAVKDWVGAAQLVEGQLCALLDAEDVQGIIRRLAVFPQDFILTRPVLLLMQAWLAHFGLRLGVMLSLTNRIQAMLDTAMAQGERTMDSLLPGFEVLSPEIVQAQVWLLNSGYAYLTNQGSQAVPLACRAAELLPESWKFARGNGMVYLGLSMFMEGQYLQVVEQFSQAYASLLEPRLTYGSRLLFCLAVCHLLQGELELCRQTAEQMLCNALAHNLLLMQGWGYNLLARVYQEWNQLDLAIKYYKLVIDQGFSSNLYCTLECIAGYVYVLESLGQPELAKQSLHSLWELFSEQIAATPLLLDSLAAWLQFKGGNQREARRWAEALQAPVARQSISWQQIPQLYQAAILVEKEHSAMETGGMENAGLVERLLAELQALAERTHNTFTLVRVLAVRAAWLDGQGNRSTALEALERALRLGRKGRFIHSFVEQGKIIMELLQALIPRLAPEAGLREYAEAVVSEFTHSEVTPPTPATLNPIKTLLTERELDVLELLAERLSINEISARLFISPSTVQQHTHHIYRKLNVSNKRQAVASAEMLGILTQK
jgi:LuxR family maltose regulon positive regulatory protein